MDRFRIVYINLSSRTDRDNQIRAQFDKIGFETLRFKAVEWKPGVIGCMKSHLKVIEMAEEKGWECVMVCEGDTVFTVDEDEFKHKLNRFLDEEREWNMVLLGYSASSIETYNDMLSKTFDAQAYSCYLIHSKYYSVFKGYLVESINGMIRTGKHWEYAIDQYCKKIQKKDGWFGFTPILAKQSNGISDAGFRPVYVDYDLGQMTEIKEDIKK